jgi:hypothetical protein
LHAGETASVAAATGMVLLGIGWADKAPKLTPYGHHRQRLIRQPYCSSSVKFFCLCCFS